MSGFEFTSTNTTPKAGLTGDTDNEASDIHNVRSLIAADFAFLVDRSPSCINIVVDDAIRGKESFTGKFEHRLRTTVFLLTPDGRGVEAVLARFVHEKREDTHRITMSQLHWAALDKIYVIVHAAVVEKMDALDRSAGGLLQTRFRLVNGVLKDAELMVPNGPPYKSEYQGY